MQLSDSNYLITVKIGTPGTLFTLIFDTGSADLWVTTPNCAGCTSTTPGFDASQSSTYMNTSTPVALYNVWGMAVGNVFQDTIVMNGLTVENQIMGISFYLPVCLG
jgi:cathepsin D